MDCGLSCPVITISSNVVIIVESFFRSWQKVEKQNNNNNNNVKEITLFRNILNNFQQIYHLILIQSK